MSPRYWVSEQMQGHRSCLKVCGRAGERKAGEARVAEGPGTGADSGCGCGPGGRGGQPALPRGSQVTARPHTPLPSVSGLHVSAL